MKQKQKEQPEERLPTTKEINKAAWYTQPGTRYRIYKKPARPASPADDIKMMHDWT